MAETGNTGEKLVSGPPPKLDLRKAGVSPAAPRPAEAAKPSAPVIKLGYSADTDVKKPQPAAASSTPHSAMPRPGGAMAAVRKPSAAAPLTRVPGAMSKTSGIEINSSSIAKTVVLDESPAERDLPISKRETSRIPIEKAVPAAAAQAVPVERAAKATSAIAPKVRDMVRAVADFMAGSQDPVGGWRYPHPRSSRSRQQKKNPLRRRE